MKVAISPVVCHKTKTTTKKSLLLHILLLQTLGMLEKFPARKHENNVETKTKLVVNNFFPLINKSIFYLHFPSLEMWAVQANISIWDICATATCLALRSYVRLA